MTIATLYRHVQTHSTWFWIFIFCPGLCVAQFVVLEIVVSFLDFNSSVDVWWRWNILFQHLSLVFSTLYVTKMTFLTSMVDLWRVLLCGSRLFSVSNWAFYIENGDDFDYPCTTVPIIMVIIISTSTSLWAPTVYWVPKAEYGLHFESTYTATTSPFIAVALLPTLRTLLRLLQQQHLLWHLLQPIKALLHQTQLHQQAVDVQHPTNCTFIPTTASSTTLPQESLDNQLLHRQRGLFVFFCFVFYVLFTFVYVLLLFYGFFCFMFLCFFWLLCLFLFVWNILSLLFFRKEKWFEAENKRRVSGPDSTKQCGDVTRRHIFASIDPKRIFQVTYNQETCEEPLYMINLCVVCLVAKEIVFKNLTTKKNVQKE